MMGRWSDENLVQLGFRRLSIMDVSENGNQPMISMYHKFCMVFNGEIYNFRELKKELLSSGYTFKSESDSEVLVNYFECFGLEKTLEVIDGMFAIALYDFYPKPIQRKKELNKWNKTFVLQQYKWKYCFWKSL